MFTGLSDGFKDVIRLFHCGSCLDADQNDGNLNTFIFFQFSFFFSILLVFATAIIKQKNQHFWCI